MIKCVITDIDQTLTNRDMILTERTKKAVKAATEKGIHIVLCSGRPFQGMKAYLEELELDREQQFCVGFNGGVVYDNATGAVIQMESFEKTEVAEIVMFLLERNINFHLESAQSIYTGFYHVGKYTVRDCFITNMPLVVDHFTNLLEREDICKIMISDFEKKLDRLTVPEALLGRYKFVRSRPYYLEVVPKGVNKGNAVKAISKLYKIKPTEILGIGDGLNDYELLRESGVSVAVENAAEELKEIANFIVPPHYEDGFAQMLEKII